VLTEQWLNEWATQLRAAVERALRDVVSGFPFEADEHRVGPPASGAELDLLRQRLPWTPDELVALHRHVGPVTLPDIGNGYFLREPDGVVAALDQQDRADQIGEPLAEHVDVVVFGSNGGGALYAVAVTDGRVFRLQDTSYIRGVYDGTSHGVTIVAADLRDFLERFLNGLNAFAMNATSPISERSGRYPACGLVRSITFRSWPRYGRWTGTAGAVPPRKPIVTPPPPASVILPLLRPWLASVLLT
jgi:hypothetical protein